MPSRSCVSLLALVSTTLALSGALTVAAPTAGASQSAGVGRVPLNGYERALLADVNHARRERGLPTLVIAAGTTDVARRWTWHLARERRLQHNPDLAADVTTSGSRDWGTAEENVGYGPAASPSTLFAAYMRSPIHRANILRGDVHYIGIGVVRRGHFAWNTMDFVNEYSTRYGGSQVPPDSMSSGSWQASRT